MGAFLLVAFIVVPIAELAVIVATSQAIGLGWTLLLLFGFSITGSVLAKRQGLELWRRVRTTLEQGRMPSAGLIDGFLVLLAGALLLSPGFLTDVVGVALLLPPVRAVIRRAATRRFVGYVEGRVGGTPPPRGRGPRRVRVVRVDSRTPPAKTGVFPPE
ncbi:MAG: FxsA family protein [Actinomycetota bacterium]